MVASSRGLATAEATPVTGDTQAMANQSAVASAEVVMKPFHNPTLPPIPPQLVKAIQKGKFVDLGGLSEAFDKAQKEVLAKAKNKYPLNTPHRLGFGIFHLKPLSHGPKNAGQIRDESAFNPDVHLSHARVNP